VIDSPANSGAGLFVATCILEVGSESESVFLFNLYIAGHPPPITQYTQTIPYQNAAQSQGKSGLVTSALRSILTTSFM
jgi:hypothetical protein